MNTTFAPKSIIFICSIVMSVMFLSLNIIFYNASFILPQYESCLYALNVFIEGILFILYGIYHVYPNSLCFTYINCTFNPPPTNDGKTTGKFMRERHKVYHTIMAVIAVIGVCLFLLTE